MPAVEERGSHTQIMTLRHSRYISFSRPVSRPPRHSVAIYRWAGGARLFATTCSGQRLGLTDAEMLGA
jgi:hypothetical protein